MLKIFIITLMAFAFVHGVPFGDGPATKLNAGLDKVVDSVANASKDTGHEVFDSLKGTGQSLKNFTLQAFDTGKHVFGTTFNVVTAPARKVGRVFKNLFGRKDK